MDTSGLINPVQTTENVTAYDRSYGGAFENPYGGAPQLTFYMQRITVRDADQSVVTVASKTNLVEPYVPGKVYDMYDPRTGALIPGVTFTADQLYAMLYSMVIRSAADKAAADAAAAAASSVPTGE